MIPYNNVSYLTHSKSGIFDSYIGFMDMNKNHISTSIDKQYIPDGSNFIAVSFNNTSTRESVIFHLSLEEVKKIKSREVVFKYKNNTCDICEKETDETMQLHSSIYNKSSIFHEDKSICKGCFDEITSSLLLQETTVETELVKMSL